MPDQPETNFANIAGRMFNRPLMMEDRAAQIIAGAFGPRLLGASNSQVVIQSAAASGIAPGLAGPGAMPKRGASLLGEGLAGYLVENRRGYEKRDGVAIIQITGALVRRGAWLGESSGQTSYEGLNAQVKAAVSDPEIKAIAFEIDTGGGEAAGCFELCETIARAREAKPIFAFLADSALSSGYAIASQCDHITVPEFGASGSIGVIMVHFDMSAAAEQAGMKITIIRAGQEKAKGNSLEPLPPELEAAWLDTSQKMRVKFASVVHAGRGDRFAFETAMKTEAAVFDGDEGRRLGLVDQVADPKASFDEMVEDIRKGGTWRAGTKSGGAVREAAITLPANALAVHGADIKSTNAGSLEASRASVAHMAAEMTAAFLADFPNFARGGVVGPREGLFLGEVGPEAILPVGASADKTSGSDRDNRAGSAHDQEEDGKMSNKTQKTPVAGAGGGATVVVEGDGKEPIADAGADATARAGTITSAVATAGLDAKFAAELIGNGKPLAECLSMIIDKKAESAADGGDIDGGTSVRITGDGIDRMRAGMENALYARAHMDGGERNEFSGMTLREMARASLVARGLTIPQGGGLALVGAAFKPSMAGGLHGTSDFGQILANVANKAMLIGFAESEETFQAWTTTGTLTDYKATKRVGLDLFPSLAEVAPGAEFKLGSMGDLGEEIMLATYGKRFGITRQAIINDDIGAFTQIPNRMGRAAKRTVGDLSYAVLTGAHLMSDAKALFHADHGNLAAAGSAPSEAAINAAITAMAEQTARDTKNPAKLNIRAAFILSGHAQRSTVLQSMNSEHAPDDTAKAGTAKQSWAANTVYKAAEPIFEARVTGNQWFMLANPSQFDTVEIAYLDGVTEPFLDQQEGWEVDGTEFKVRLDAAAKATAWEGLYKNPGQ